MMTAGMLVVLFFIVGMFLSMIGSSPKSESDSSWKSDTDTGEELPIRGATSR